MDYETIVRIEDFIESLSNPRKKIIARELVVHTNFEIFHHQLFGKTELLIKDKTTLGIFKLLTYIDSKCNCGR
jgi:hypothetical protein